MDSKSGERQEGIILDEIEEKHVERYIYASKFCVGKHVLDAGCGVGYGSTILAGTANSVVSVDYSDDALSWARKYFATNNIEHKQFDLTGSLDDLGKFDAVVCLENIEHLDVPIEDTLRKYYGIINSGGIIVVSHPEMEPVCNNKWHKHFNISGKKVASTMTKLGFKVIDDWMQPKRFLADYHVIVAEK